MTSFPTTTLLPGQDKPAPSEPTVAVSGVGVCCGVRLSEVGLEVIPKLRVDESKGLTNRMLWRSRQDSNAKEAGSQNDYIAQSTFLMSSQSPLLPR